MAATMIAGLANAGDTNAGVMADEAAPAGLRDSRVWRGFLLANLPRAFALSPGGQAGWSDGDGEASARAGAIAACADAGGLDCRIYACDLEIVTDGPCPPPAPERPPLIATVNYAFVADARFRWRGPQAAAGVLVWAHGRSGAGFDERGQQPPAYTRAFNNAGFDIVRFDRAPLADDTVRASYWLRDGLARLRERGWRRIVAAGQSRGAWNVLQTLDTPGLADVVIAISAAAHGSGASLNLYAQTDDLRAMTADLPLQTARVAFVQFADDPFIGSADARRRIVERNLGPRVAALLMLDRPNGLHGHLAGGGRAFAERYGPCLLRFALAEPARSDTCEAPAPTDPRRLPRDP